MCTLCGRRPRLRPRRMPDDDPFACVCQPVVVTRAARGDELGEAKVCPICLEPFSLRGDNQCEHDGYHDRDGDGDVPDDAETGGAVIADCGHPLHANCLAQWLLKDVRVSCPVCRAPYQVAASTTAVAPDEAAGERSVAVREPGGVQTVIAFTETAERARAADRVATGDADESADADVSGAADERSPADAASPPSPPRSGFENVVITGVVVSGPGA